MFGGAKAWSKRKIAPKPCKSCELIFQPTSGGNKYCKECAPLQKRKNHAVAWYNHRHRNFEKHQKYKSSYDLQKKYGISLKEYEEKLEKQNNGCAICGNLDPKGRGRYRKFAVDHCHRTGKVRALLCHSCNGALGMVNDDVTILGRMIDYLKEHRNE